MTPRAHPPLHRALALIVLATAWAWSPSATAQTQNLSFDEARARTLEQSDRLRAAQAAQAHRALQVEGLKKLGGPLVSVSTAAYHYNANASLNVDPFNQQLAQIGQSLARPLGAMGVHLPGVQLPSALNRSDTTTSSSVSAVVPLYTGVNDAVRHYVSAQRQENQADTDQTEHEVHTQLVQRYFGAQLAARAAQLRAEAEKTIAEHDAAAQRMLDAGLIARVERLQARAALEDARRNARKAQDDADLAAAALARTVKLEGAVTALTPLFVSSTPIEPLPHFIDLALNHHPGLAKVGAKKAQAQALHEGEESLRKPQVFAFGARDLRTSQSNWIAGVGARWTLYDSVDRDAMARASLKLVEQAELTDAQARNDIALLVERNWRALDQARRQYLALQPSVDLAQEMLRLRSAGLREGTSTTLDLIDAQTNLAKVQTERAQAANDYVQALAQLLESCGQSDQFSTYLQRADLKVN